ncbi:hypothetical protein GJ496_000984 [Pomphorhynchus laevis]|nr:hypothetical protein GJ496_000984 [Pomphorhynchus laevis]
MQKSNPSFDLNISISNDSNSPSVDFQMPHKFRQIVFPIHKSIISTCSPSDHQWQALTFCGNSRSLLTNCNKLSWIRNPPYVYFDGSHSDVHLSYERTLRCFAK